MSNQASLSKAVKAWPWLAEAPWELSSLEIMPTRLWILKGLKSLRTWVLLTSRRLDWTGISTRSTYRPVQFSLGSMQPLGNPRRSSQNSCSMIGMRPRRSRFLGRPWNTWIGLTISRLMRLTRRYLSKMISGYTSCMSALLLICKSLKRSFLELEHISSQRWKIWLTLRLIKSAIARIANKFLMTFWTVKCTFSSEKFCWLKCSWRYTSTSVTHLSNSEFAKL